MSDQPTRIARRLLLDERVAAAELADPALREQVGERLALVGFALTQSGEQWCVVALIDDDEPDGYSEPQRAALALAVCELVVAPDPARAGEGIPVGEFADRLGQTRGYSRGWIRRAVLGPLERDGYLRIVEPGGRRAESVIHAGPRLALIDQEAVRRGLERLAG